MEQQTVLITGGAGYIGSHISWLCAQQGYRVIILDTFVYQQQVHLPWATVIRGDTADTKVLDHICTTYKPLAVIHCAAYVEVAASIKDPRLYYHNNVSKTITLLQAMLTHGIRHIIFSSSCAVYGNPERLPMDERHPKQPLSPYGWSKLMVEQVLTDYARAYDLNFFALRYFNVAGAQPEQGLGEQHIPETHIVPLLLKALHEGKPFTIFGQDYDTPDGTCIRDYVHVRDIAHAHLLALHHLLAGKPSDICNLGAGRGYSVKQMVDMAQQVCGKQVDLQYASRRAGDPDRLVAHTSKVQDVLSWHPRYSELGFVLRSAYEFLLQSCRA